MGEELQAGVCNSTWWNLPKSPFGYWPSGGDFVEEMNNHKATRSSDDSGGSVSDHQPDSGGGGGGGGGVWMDSSTFQMMGINGISSPSSSTSTDWNQTLFGRRESNFNSSMIQEDMNSRLNFQPQIQKEWSTSTTTTTTTTNGFNQTNQGFSLDQANSQDYPSIFLQTLFDSTDPQPQPPLFDNQSMTYSNEFPPSSFAKLSPLLSPSLPKQQPINPPLNLTQTAPFWNASSAPLSDIRASFFPLTTFEKKPNCPNLISKSNDEAVRDSCSTVGKKSSSEPVFKRPRIETPSPLPTFKVRKEKLGDRITALQQLVSPFGKTDTASVLQEAIEYIKFLHDQVNVLSPPYVKNGAPIHHHQNCDQLKNNSERPKPDLRSRGLCLVPITSTFPVANETSVDFWTPTFGSTSI